MDLKFHPATVSHPADPKPAKPADDSGVVVVEMEPAKPPPLRSPWRTNEALQPVPPVATAPVAAQKRAETIVEPEAKPVAPPVAPNPAIADPKPTAETPKPRPDPPPTSAPAPVTPSSGPKRPPSKIKHISRKSRRK
ncbi:unnamed protein product, partial [Mesorhabditis spiculigera]